MIFFFTNYEIFIFRSPLIDLLFENHSSFVLYAYMAFYIYIPDVLKYIQFYCELFPHFLVYHGEEWWSKPKHEVPFDSYLHFYMVTQDCPICLKNKIQRFLQITGKTSSLKALLNDTKFRICGKCGRKWTGRVTMCYDPFDLNIDWLVICFSRSIFIFSWVCAHKTTLILAYNCTFVL